jgi:hypothetical protein
MLLIGILREGTNMSNGYELEATPTYAPQLQPKALYQKPTLRPTLTNWILPDLLKDLWTIMDRRHPQIWT